MIRQAPVQKMRIWGGLEHSIKTKGEAGSSSNQGPVQLHRLHASEASPAFFYPGLGVTKAERRNVIPSLAEA